jgi:hypothetical protein
MSDGMQCVWAVVLGAIIRPTTGIINMSSTDQPADSEDLTVFVSKNVLLCCL